jgi:hypothetical protein
VEPGGSVTSANMIRSSLGINPEGVIWKRKTVIPENIKSHNNDPFFCASGIPMILHTSCSFDQICIESNEKTFFEIGIDA